MKKRLLDLWELALLQGKIATRNLLLHKGKTLIVGTILFIGAFLMTLGNSTLTGMEVGIRRGIVDGFMGDLLVISKREPKDDTLMAAMGEASIVISNFDSVRGVLSNHPAVKSFLPFNKGILMAVIEGESPVGDPPWCLALGVDFARYREMFDNIEIVSGRMPRPGERGMLLSSKNRERFLRGYNTLFSSVSAPDDTNRLPLDLLTNAVGMTPTTNVVLMGMSDKNSTLDVRVPILGIYRNKKLTAMDDIDLLDLETYREAMNYSTAADSGRILTARETALLSMDENPDSFFGEDLITSAASAAAPDVRSLFATGRKTNGEAVDLDKGAYELVAVKLKNGRNDLVEVASIQKSLAEAGTDARAVHWKKAMGQVAQLVSIIKGALFGFTFFLFFVAIIIIMNTLAMTTMERVSEFGMMRAVGARKGFLGWMLFAETSVIAAGFGGLGMVAGSVTTVILANARIPATSDILSMVFGGNYFLPLVTASDLALGAFELFLVTLLASAYPILLIRRVTPLDAISRD